MNRYSLLLKPPDQPGWRFDANSLYLIRDRYPRSPCPCQNAFRPLDHRQIHQLPIKGENPSPRVLGFLSPFHYPAGIGYLVFIRGKNALHRPNLSRVNHFFPLKPSCKASWHSFSSDHCRDSESEPYQSPADQSCSIHHQSATRI